MPLILLDDRLNAILDRVTSVDFLSGRGLGNEVPFYAFDYPPEAEEQVRVHIRFLLEAIPKRKPDLRVACVNLLELLIAMLEARGLYQKSLDVQRTKGDDALLKALLAPLTADKVAAELIKRHPPGSCDVLFVTGVGSAYPLIRTHTLLNSLQPRIGATPLVLFYPGRYDGQSLRLFGDLGESPYYRAFRLVG